MRLAGVMLVVLLSPATAALAQPANFPHGTADQQFTTTQPGAPTGLTFMASYHAAGDPKGDPPYLRRVVISPPPGLRYDTSVPDRCAAPDIELQVMGPDACPPGSRLGTGTIDGVIYAPVTHAFVFDRYHHDLYVLNSADGQILLVKSEGYTVARGHLRPDGSMEFDPPTCFPSPPTGCADDYVVQTKTATSIPAYTKGARSYATTPSTCPRQRYWQTTLRYWWSDGSTDTAVSRQPCTRGRRR
jgi:hypothetical protein